MKRESLEPVDDGGQINGEHKGLALAALLASLAATGLATEPTPGLPPRLRVLVPADEMPEMFSFDTKGQPGFELELIEGFCRIHGLALVVFPVQDFDQIIPMLLRREGDVITGIVDTVARRKKVAFSSEVFPVRHMAITRRPGPFARQLEDLRELRVGTIPETTWEQAVIEAGVPKNATPRVRHSSAMLCTSEADSSYWRNRSICDRP